MKCNSPQIGPWALVASLCVAACVRAADTPSGAASEPAGQSAPASQPQAAAPSTWPPGLIMDSLKGTAAGKEMDGLGLRLWGVFESSFTGRLTGNQDPLPLRLYDGPRPNSPRLNQLQLTLERPYDNSKSFDFGARIDGLYGGDARLTHEAGLLDHVGGLAAEDYRWADVLQAYTQLWFKTGKESGLELTLGKFLEQAGSESAETTLNLLYSRSNLYTFLEPTTHTGGMAKYYFNSQVFGYFGVVEGWDVFRDNNSAMTYLAGGGWSSQEQIAGHARTQALLNIITGPERTDDNSDYRTLVDVIINQSWTEKLSESLNVEWLAEENVPGVKRDNKRAEAYGAAHYLTYTFSDYVSGTWRVEGMRDDGGWRTGVNGALYESTWGLSITPAPSHPQLKNLVLRPEFRCDWSDKANAFGQGHESQLTLAADLIYKF